MENAKPALVIIYGPEMRPSYPELLEIKKQCEDEGQKVHLIPPPDKSGKPSYEVDKQNLPLVTKELGKIKGEYTLLVETHGTVISGEHYSSVGSFYHDGVISTRNIIKAAFKSGNCTGLYDGSCYSGTTIAQVSEEVVLAKKPKFEFVADSPLDATAGMEDSALFLKNLTAMAKKGTPMTAINMQDHYLQTLGDGSVKTYSSPVYRRIFGAEQEPDENGKYTFTDLGAKLDRLIEASKEPGFTLTVPEAVKQQLGPDNTAKVLAVFVDKDLAKYSFTEKGLLGEALIMANGIYPGNNQTASKDEILLRTSQDYELARNFSKVSPEARLAFTKNNPNAVLNVAADLKPFAAEAKQYIVMAAKEMAQKDTGELVHALYGGYHNYPQTRQWSWAFDDKHELAEVLLTAKQNHTKKTQAYTTTADLALLSNDGATAIEIIKASKCEDVVQQLYRYNSDVVNNIAGIDSRQLNNALLDKIVEDNPCVVLIAHGGDRFAVDEILKQSGRSEATLKEDCARSLYKTAKDIEAGKIAPMKVWSLLGGRNFGYFFSGDWIEALPESERAKATEVMKVVKEAKDKKQAAVTPDGLEGIAAQINASGVKGSEDTGQPVLTAKAAAKSMLS